MKKIGVLIGAFLISFVSFSQDGGKQNNNERINQRIVTAFHEEFPGAENVHWTAGSNYYLAEFEVMDNKVLAYFNDEADLLATTRYIASPQLPIYLQVGLKKKYPDFWISDLFELSSYKGMGYYITLENAEKKLVLSASNGSDWSVYKRVSKE